MRKTGNKDFKTMIIQNYDVMQGMVSKGFGKAFIFKVLIDKYGYSDSLKLSKIYVSEKDLYTFLICRKNNEPIISEYLRRLKL